MFSARGLLLIALLTCLTIISCRTNGETAATATAHAWLSMIDAGNYSQGWTDAAPYLQRVATEAEWEASMNRMRGPLGKVLSRTTRSATATRTALNDPCVIVEDETLFENKQSAVETITVMPVHDAQWKVAGYYIK